MTELARRGPAARSTSGTRRLSRVAAAFALGRAASSLLFGMQGHDPIVFALSLLVLLVVALGAGYLPARRASRVDATGFG